MATVVNVTHGCAGGGGANGLIPVQRKASSACCGAKLNRRDDGGYTCKGCGKPCTKVMSDPVAHWTCTCGQQRHQQVTYPQDGES